MSTKIKQTEPSWTPQRRGDIYCAPTCGGQCKHADYIKAVRESKWLARRLRGNRWRPVVWENLGWHYKVVSGPIQVCLSHDRKSYFAMIGDNPRGSAGGAGFWHPPQNKSFTDPNDAVEYALGFAFAFADLIEKTVKAAEQAAGLTREGIKQRVERGQV